MNLQSLFVAFEKAGLNSIGQIRSALAVGGANPLAVQVSHPELDKLVAELKPATAAAAGAVATSVTSKVDPAAAPLAGELASRAVDTALGQILPELQHQMEVLGQSLSDALERHMSPVHAALQTVPARPTAPAAAAAAASPPTAPAAGEASAK